MSGNQKGLFITLEGIDGAGKSTQLEYLAELFRQMGREVLTTREPGGTRTGEHIRDIILQGKGTGIHEDTELMLMFSARTQHYQEIIKPAIAANKVVISDRFADSSYAYQGGGCGIPKSRIDQLYQWVLADFRPDLTFLFDIEAEQGMERIANPKQADCFDGRADRFERERGTGFFERIRACYLELAGKEPERIKIIDASQSLEQIRRELKTIVEESALCR